MDMRTGNGLEYFQTYLHSIQPAIRHTQPRRPLLQARIETDDESRQNQQQVSWSLLQAAELLVRSVYCSLAMSRDS